MSRISDSDFFVCSRSGKAMLSYRFMEPNSAPSWNSTPNSLRSSYSRDSEQRTRSVSWMTIDPRSGLSSPMRVFRNTDLPVPDGPSSTETSPGGSVSVTSDQMLARPKDFVSPSTLTSTPATRRLLQPGPAGQPTGEDGRPT